MTDSRPVLETQSVSRQFGYRPVVRDVTLRLAAGEVLLLTGPNGAGKTTLLRLAAGLLRPSAGVILRHAEAGYVAHDAMLYDALSARENLRFFARLHGIADPDRVDTLLARMDLTDRAADRVATFSRGMVQRVAIARALLPSPGLLLLDEPLNGLDVGTVTVLETLLAEQRAAGTAMMIVTHQPESLAGLATRHATITAGAFAERSDA